jgi:hypothetical protein
MAFSLRTPEEPEASVRDKKAATFGGGTIIGILGG